MNGDFVKTRQHLVNDLMEALEALSGRQIVGLVSLEEDGSTTFFTWCVSQELAQRVWEDIASQVWNAPKSL